MFIAACGGGGGGDSDDTSILPDGVVDVSGTSEMYSEYQKIQEELVKSDFETSEQYSTRIAEFVVNSPTYYAEYNPTDLYYPFIGIYAVEYDPESQQFLIRVPSSLKLKVQEGTTEFYGRVFADGPYYDWVTIDDVEVTLIGLSELYTPIEIPYTNNSGDPGTIDYFATISSPPEEAENIADGFVFEYEFKLSQSQMENAGITCVSAYLTNCNVRIDANAINVRLKNTKTNQYY